MIRPELKPCILSISLLLLLLLAGREAGAVVPVDSVTVSFRFGRGIPDSAYRENRQNLARLRAMLADAEHCGRVDSVWVVASCSPDGLPEYNRLLAWERARSMRTYLHWKCPALDRSLIGIGVKDSGPKELLAMVLADPQVPCRSEVAALLAAGGAAVWNTLAAMGGGRVYGYMADHMLYRLRSATVYVARNVSGESDVREEEQISTVNSPEESSPLLYGGTAADEEPSGVSFAGEDAVPSRETEKRQGAGGEGFRAVSDGSAAERHPGRRPPWLALKTNLLFDAVLIPNLEVEVSLGRRWSVDGTCQFPWWRFGDDTYCMQLLSGEVEGRLWLGRREGRTPLTGHFFGLYAGGGMYDFQWKEKGYQGEFYIAAGVSYGYGIRLGSRFNMEFSLGIGYIRTDYRHYRPMENNRVLAWQKDGTYTWIGPTRAKVSLVWLVGRRGKGGVR